MDIKPKADDKKVKYLEDKYNAFKNKYEPKYSLKKSSERKKNLISKLTGGFVELSSPVDIYKQGKISFEEADKFINNYDKANKSTLNLSANILASLAATTVGIFAGKKINSKYALPAVVAIGAAVGAIVRPAIKIFSRATNRTEHDAFDKEEIKKDIIAGSVNGALAGVNAGIGKEFTKKNVISKIGFEIGKQTLMALGEKLAISQQTKKAAEEENKP